jgi:hypothetical protein
MSTARDKYVALCASVGCKANSTVLALLPGQGDNAASVQAINLSLTLVGPVGFKALVPCFSLLPSLAVLDASRNEIDNECVALLAQHVMSHPSLTCISLSGNRISHNGAKDLLKLAVGNTKLVAINLDDNAVNAATKDRIAKTCALHAEAAAAAKVAEEAASAPSAPPPAPADVNTETVTTNGHPTAPSADAETPADGVPAPVAGSSTSTHSSRAKSLRSRKYLETLYQYSEELDEDMGNENAASGEENGAAGDEAADAQAEEEQEEEESSLSPLATLVNVASARVYRRRNRAFVSSLENQSSQAASA